MGREPVLRGRDFSTQRLETYCRRGSGVHLPPLYPQLAEERQLGIALMREQRTGRYVSALPKRTHSKLTRPSLL